MEPANGSKTVQTIEGVQDVTDSRDMLEPILIPLYYP